MVYTSHFPYPALTLPHPSLGVSCLSALFFLCCRISYSNRDQTAKPRGQVGGGRGLVGVSSSAQFSKPKPYFRPKYAIFWYPFQSDLASKIHTRIHTHFETFGRKWLKSILRFRPQWLKNHTLLCCTYLCTCTLYRVVPPEQLKNSEVIQKANHRRLQ